MQLVVEQGTLAGQVFTLREQAIEIGRARENDLVLPDQGVSRRHVRIERSPEGWVLADLGSTNGTIVNENQLQRGHLLRPGDRVQLGGAVLLVQQEPGDDVSQREVRAEQRSSVRRHPAVMLVAALLAVVLMAGLVLLLVTILQPEEKPPMATPANPIEQMMTSLPVPTEVQEAMTAIIPLISTALPQPWLGATPTPSPSPSQGGRVAPAAQLASGSSQGNRQGCPYGCVPCAEAIVYRSGNSALVRGANP